jgi:hypothetical protein
MSATSQVTTFSDLYTDLQNRVRATTSVTATENQAKRYVNIALHDMHIGFDYRFPWAERSAVLRTRPQYSTGTLTATKGSASITGSSTAWNTADDFSITNVRANGKIRIAGAIDPYTVLSVSTETSATLTSVFVETTTSGATYVYYEDEYDLASDFLRPVDAQRFSDQMSIDLIGRTEFRRRYPANSTPGRPTVATIIDSAPSGNTTPIRRVRLHPAPSTTIRIPYTYITGNLAVSSAGVAAANLSSDTDEPIVPLRYRHAIVFGALYHWYRDKKDDARTDAAKQEYIDLVMRMAGDMEVGAVRPQIRPRVQGYVRRAKRPYSGGAGRRYDVGGRFDRMED